MTINTYLATVNDIGSAKNERNVHAPKKKA